MVFEWFLYRVICAPLFCYSSKNRVLSFELQTVKIKVDDRRMKIFDDSITATNPQKVVAFKYHGRCFATSEKTVKTTIESTKRRLLIIKKFVRTMARSIITTATNK